MDEVKTNWSNSYFLHLAYTDFQKSKKQFECKK